MRGWKLAAVAVALAVFVGLSLADNNVQNQGTYYKNAQSGAKTDASGNAYITESTPAMDANLTFASIISSTLASGAADSSAILDTHKIRLGMLLIKATPATTGSDTNGVARLIFQVRTHLNGAVDSASVFAIYPYGTAPALNATAAASDTSIQGHLQKGVAITAHTATPESATPWSGEFVVTVQAIRNAHGNSIAVNGHTFYYPSGMAIPLQSLFGRDVFSPYTSIRVRNGGNAGTQASCVVTIHLIGTPL